MTNQPNPFDARRSDLLPPPVLTPEQEYLCQRLDKLYEGSQLNPSGSAKFRGAIFAARPECRSNPDWMAQAANSLREILLPIWKGDKQALLHRIGSARAEEGRIEQDVGTLLTKCTKLTHHELIYTDEEFEAFLLEYQRTMLRALARQLDVHAEIDRLITEGIPKETSEIHD